MEAIKRRYKVAYNLKDDFITAMVNLALDPKEENALMRGAIKQFNLIPKQPFNMDELIKILEYIYNNDIEKPEWFENHFNDEHPKGMGNGQGKRRGRGMNIN